MFCTKIFYSSRHSGHNSAPSAKTREASGRLNISNKTSRQAKRNCAQFASVQHKIHSCRVQSTPWSSRFKFLWAYQNTSPQFPHKNLVVNSSLSLTQQLAQCWEYWLRHRHYEVCRHFSFQIRQYRSRLKAIYFIFVQAMCVLSATNQHRHIVISLGRPKGGLMFYPWCYLSLFFRHAFSEVPRPIALKLCHMIRIWPYFIIPLQKFGGRSPQKIGGQKHAKFRSILDHFRLWLRISPERLKISKIGRRHKLWQFLQRLMKKIRWTLVH